jgi:hypothetical protein
MRIHIDDPGRSKDLVRHFRARGYLAVERAPGTIEVVPIEGEGDEANRARTLADLAEWASANDVVGVTLLRRRGLGNRG